MSVLSRKKIILIVIGLTTLTAIVALLSYNTKNPNDDQSTQYQAEHYQSMEDGELMSEDDVKFNQSIMDYASEQAKQYFSDKYNGAQAINTTSSEWYLTDDNASFNILVGADILTAESDLIHGAIVLEIATNKQSFELISTYPPDSRYIP